jgi:lipoate-protein ligase A
MFDYEYWGSEELPANVNMALEEYFLRRRKKAVFRLWSFTRDAAILGYAQATDAIKKQDSSFDIARRISGGSHVQTGQNILAYTVVVPREGTFRNYEDMRAYYAEKVALALEGLGIENVSVDNRASTVNVDGKVIASHAIVWGVERALLHGLVIISPYDVDKMHERMHLAERKIGSKVYTEYSALKNMPVISRLLDDVAPEKNDAERVSILKEIAGDALLKQFIGGKHENMKINTKVMKESQALIKRKFGTGAWTKSKKPPFTEHEIEEIPGEQLDGPLKKGLGYCMYSQVKDSKFKKMAAQKD